MQIEKQQLSLFHFIKTVEYLPNRLTPFNSEIYYKKENYLKVKTAAFKYTTPSHSKRFSILVCWYISILCSHIPIFPRFEFYYVTQLPLILQFYQFHQSHLLYTNFNPIQVLFQYLYYPVYKVCNTRSLLFIFVFEEFFYLQVINQRCIISCFNLITFLIPNTSYQIFSI